MRPSFLKWCTETHYHMYSFKKLTSENMTLATWTLGLAKGDAGWASALNACGNRMKYLEAVLGHCVINMPEVQKNACSV